MIVYYVSMLQGDGEYAVCATEEKGKEWLKESISRHQGNKPDPDPWGGWTFRREEDGSLSFGCFDEAEWGVEGMIQSMEVLV